MEKIIIRSSDGSMVDIENEVNDILTEGWRLKHVSVAANSSGNYGTNQLLVFAFCKEEEEEKKRKMGFKDHV